jgi:hypothetical protein
MNTRKERKGNNMNMVLPLGVPPGVIIEFLPEPSQAYLESLNAAVERANQTGWLEGDPITGMPTGKRVSDILPLRVSPE